MATLVEQYEELKEHCNELQKHTAALQRREQTLLNKIAALEQNQSNAEEWHVRIHRDDDLRDYIENLRRRGCKGKIIVTLT